MEKPNWKYDKISSDESKKIKNVLEQLKGKYSSIEETPDTFRVRVPSKENDDGEITFGFTKIGDMIPVEKGGESPEFYHLSEVMDAKIRFPEKNIAEALDMLKQLKEEKKKE